MCAPLCEPCGSRTERAEEEKKKNKAADLEGWGTGRQWDALQDAPGFSGVAAGAKQRRRERETDPGSRFKQPSLRPSCPIPRFFCAGSGQSLEEEEVEEKAEREREKKKLRSHKPTRGSGKQDRD